MSFPNTAEIQKYLSAPISDKQSLVVRHSLQDVQNSSNGSVTDKSSRYDIGELATSSLMGETHTRMLCLWSRCVSL